MKCAALFLLVPCGCAAGPAPEPGAGVAMIEVSSDSFHGSRGTRIYADGTLIADAAAPGQPLRHSVRKGSRDAYASAAAVLHREGDKANAAIRPQVRQCFDYGTDVVRAVPPVAGFDQAVAACPDTAMTALMVHVLAGLAQP